MVLLARDHRSKVSFPLAGRETIAYIAMWASSEELCFVKRCCLQMIYYNEEVNYIKVAGQK
jgi:hypothetical protein